MTPRESTAFTTSSGSETCRPYAADGRSASDSEKQISGYSRGSGKGLRKKLTILEQPEFILSEDYNKMTPVKNYQAHQSRVTMVLFVLELEWVLSTGQDKQFAWHCSESGQRLGCYRTRGVTALCWDPVQRVLFSGSSDHSVIMWDI
ncbi:hypothetical protein A6R68_01209, partial [Neotoma lepida]